MFRGKAFPGCAHYNYYNNRLWITLFSDAMGTIPIHLTNALFETLCVSIHNKNGYSQQIDIQTLEVLLVSMVAFARAFITNLTDRRRAFGVDQTGNLHFANHTANT